VRQHRDFGLHIQKFSAVMSHAYWKQLGSSCRLSRQSDVKLINKVC